MARFTSAIFASLAIASLPAAVQGGFNNLVVNPSFEISEPIGGYYPDTAGDWSVDMATTVGAENGIVPRTGDQMLRFDATNLNGAQGQSSDIVQLIDLSEYSCSVQSGSAVANLSAYFNRVLGNAETDRQFTVLIRTFTGAISDFPNNFGNFTAQMVADVISDGDVETWELAEVSLTLPPDASYLAVVLGAVEDVFDDQSSEFDGHYADDVCLEIVADAGVEQHAWGQSVRFEFWITNVSGSDVDGLRLADPRIVTLDGHPDESVTMLGSGILDESPIPLPGQVPDRWSRINQDSLHPNFLREAWWFFPDVTPTAMAPDMIVSFTPPVAADSVVYEVDYYLYSGADVVHCGIVRFDCSPLDTSTVDEDLPHTDPPRRKSFLQQNSPNPFRPMTSISYQVERQSDVTLAIYDLQGRLIRRLVREAQYPGSYSVSWDGRTSEGRRVAAGTYLYSLTVGDRRESRKLVIIP